MFRASFPNLRKAQVTLAMTPKLVYSHRSRRKTGKKETLGKYRFYQLNIFNNKDKHIKTKVTQLQTLILRNEARQFKAIFKLDSLTLKEQDLNGFPSTLR